jgi:glutamine synthetase
VPGYEAPVNLVYSLRNRSAAVRIPMYSENPKSKRIEFRPPDPMCNPYLSFSALLMAGIDGIKKKMDPGLPFEGNAFELEGKAAKKLPTVPGSLEQAIDALEADHKFLLEGGVFTQDVIDVWIDYKRAEIDGVRLRPHPYEFHLYFDM